MQENEIVRITESDKKVFLILGFLCGLFLIPLLSWFSGFFLNRFLGPLGLLVPLLIIYFIFLRTKERLRWLSKGFLIGGVVSFGFLLCSFYSIGWL